MTDKNALEPVATVTVRSIGGDTVDTIPGRDYVLAQDAAAIIAKLTQERDEAVSAVQRMSDGQPFDAVVIADTAKRIAAQENADLRAQLAAMTAEMDALKRSQHFGKSDSIDKLVEVIFADFGHSTEYRPPVDKLTNRLWEFFDDQVTAAQSRIAELEAALAVRDAYPQAHRLAMELECFMLSCTDTAVTAKWWDSANEALEQWREFNAAQGADALKGAPTEKGGE